MDKPEQIAIEVAYAEPGKQIILAVKVSPGTSVWDAVNASGILQKVPTIDLEQQAVGVYGKIARKPKEQTVSAGDRIEIYRPVKNSLAKQE